MSEAEGSNEVVKTDHEPVDHEKYAGRFVPDPWDEVTSDYSEEGGHNGQLGSGDVPGISS
jgi:hypothetical protein